jgi:hypothetical protein
MMDGMMRKKEAEEGIERGYLSFSEAVHTVYSEPWRFTCSVFSYVYTPVHHAHG